MAPAVFHLIPHTHWDREWYLARSAFAVRLAWMFDELLPMLEAHPALRFTLDGQTVLVEDYLAQRPAARDRIVRLVAAGRLAVGPWYVLADEIIPSPPALHRNLAVGLADATALGGVMRVLYSPDAFGHPGWLPGLALDAGLRWGVVWRGLAGDPAGGPDLRRWSGTDGRSILVHHLPPAGYEVGAHLPGAGPRLAEAWAPLRDELLSRSLTRHVALPVGSDHHTPHPELPRLAERLQGLEPGHQIRFSRWEDYFEGVESEGPVPPVVRGELRWSYRYTWSLQGVHGSRARLKRRYGEAERWLAAAETLTGVEERSGGRLDRQLLEPLSRTLVRSQFHDTLAGTVNDEVGREQAVRLDAVVTGCREVVRERLLELAGLAADERRAGGTAASVILWAARLDAWMPDDGPAASAPGVVAVPIDRFIEDVLVGPPGARRPRQASLEPVFSLRAPDGAPVPYQLLRREIGLHRGDRRYGYPDLDRVERAWVALELAPSAVDRPLVLRVAGGRPQPPRCGDPVRVVRRSLENGAVRVTVAADGSVTLFDRATGERYPGLLTCGCEPDDGDLYTPWIGPAARSARADVLGAERIAAGPLIGGFAIHWRIEARQGEVLGRTAVALHAGSGLLRCRIDVDNRAWQHRLRLALPVGVAGPARAYDGTGWVEREPLRSAAADFPAEWPAPTAPTHGVVSVGQGRRRLTVTSPGFFEYEWTSGGVLMVTLLRAVGTLSRGDLAPRPGHAGWVTPTPEAQEAGPHTIELMVGVGPELEPPPPTVFSIPVLGAP